MSDKQTATVTCLDRSGRVMGDIEAPKGAVLFRVLERVGFVYGSCGGFGSCGGCAVELEDGRLVQSCFVRVTEDITVRKRSL